MGEIVFIPLTDDLIYEHPDQILGPVIPFSQQGRRAAVKLGNSVSGKRVAITKKFQKAPNCRLMGRSIWEKNESR